MELHRQIEKGSRRVWWVLPPLILLFLGVEARLLSLQVLNGEEFDRQAEENSVSIRLSKPVRGRILDASGRVLAEDRPVWGVAVNFNDILDQDLMHSAIVSQTGQDPERIKKIVGTGWGDAYAPQVRAMRVVALENLLSRLARLTGHTVPELTDAVRAAEDRLVAREIRERVRVAGLILESETLSRADVRKRVKSFEEGLARRLRALIPTDEFLMATGFRWNLERAARLERQEFYGEIAAEAGLDMARVKKKVAELDRGCARRLIRSLRNDDHLLVEGDVDYDMVARIELDPERYPGVSVRYEAGRQYPYGPCASHVVGYVGYLGWARRHGTDVNLYEEREQDGFFWIPLAKFLDREQYEHIERRGEFYRDLFGKVGIEAACNDALRGRRGARIVLRDRRNRVQRDLQCHPPEHGADIRLTLDVELQKRAYAAFDRVRPLLMRGTPLRGSAVVLDVETGAVLALVSLPAYDANLMVPPVSKETMNGYFRDAARPLLHRAISGLYPPGSTFKVVSGLAALEEEIVTPETLLDCADGVYHYGRHKFRCWRLGGHGQIKLQKALEQSCNVYFYRVGRELGPALRRWAEMWGFGNRTGIDIAGEKGGQLPPGRGGDWVQMAIGQRMTATPLQVARLMAIVANGGRQVVPHLLAENGVLPEWQVPVVSPKALATVKQGLEDVVHGDEGTAALPRLIRLQAAGKTGTAQTGRRVNGVEMNDAWFAGYAPRKNPRVALAVVVEEVPHGVHGGDAAAPVAAAILETALELTGGGE